MFVDDSVFLLFYLWYLSFLFRNLKEGGEYVKEYHILRIQQVRPTNSLL